MIYDRIDSSSTNWLSMHTGAFAEAFQWLREMPADIADGITELRGRLLYAHVQSYNTQPPDSGRWESHRHTIDIQYIFGGGEVIDYQRPGVLTPNNDYTADGDVEFWQPTEPPASTLRMAPGTYVVFFAGEPHRPRGADAVHPAVRKVVVKIDASLIT